MQSKQVVTGVLLGLVLTLGLREAVAQTSLSGCWRRTAGYSTYENGSRLKSIAIDCVASISKDKFVQRCIPSSDRVVTVANTIRFVNGESSKGSYEVLSRQVNGKENPPYNAQYNYVLTGDKLMIFQLQKPIPGAQSRPPPDRNKLREESEYERAGSGFCAGL